MTSPTSVPMNHWKLHAGDCIDWLGTLVDDSIDLLFTSPPYLEARTYGIGAGRKLEPWVEWMMAVVKAAAPKVKGLIAINCEGQTKNFRYLPSPFLLMADLHRAGFNLRKPAVFHRSGIPGSGGPDWLRNDWEPIICITRPGQLPWSDNTACGKSPRFEPGGAMSNRLTSGERRVSFRKTVSRPSDSGAGMRSEVGDEVQSYTPPKIANPGNVLKINVGGGHLSSLSTQNEAPFPLALPEFFVKSFAPPGSVVADPFCGSGTTGEAAITHGREFWGCDIRESQIRLSERRFRTITPCLSEIA